MIDAHAHLTDPRLDAHAVVAQFLAEGGRAIVDAGFDAASSLKAYEDSRAFDTVYFTCGFHPSEAGKENDFSVLEKLACDKKCVAVGEIGLDYHYPGYDPARQKELFLFQLKIAREKGLPIVVHSRDCSGDMADLLSANADLIKNGFLMHCYSESAEQAKIYAALGGYFSFGGVTTFKNAKKDEIIRSIPFDRLLLETDSPYLAPEPLRGSLNRPSYVSFVYEKIANVRGVTVEKLKKTVEENFLRLFKKVSL